MAGVSAVEHARRAYAVNLVGRAGRAPLVSNVVAALVLARAIESGNVLFARTACAAAMSTPVVSPRTPIPGFEQVMRRLIETPGLADRQTGPIANTYSCVRKGFWAAAALSGIVNILMLTGPLFMLQVYDRVLSSQSIPTLVTLLAFVIGLYAMMAIFDFLRPVSYLEFPTGWMPAWHGRCLKAGLNASRLLARPVANR